MEPPDALTDKEGLSPSSHSSSERKILGTLNRELAGEECQALPRPNATTPGKKVLGSAEGCCYEAGPFGVMVQIASSASLFSTDDSLRMKL
jgi:hypothetical protein